MVLADRGLNLQAEAIEEAQTQIRIIVRDGWLNRLVKSKINAKVQQAIERTLKGVTNVNLRDAAMRSLNIFADRQYNTYLKEFGFDPTYVVMVLSMSGLDRSSHALDKQIADSSAEFYETTERGVPLQQYAEEYAKQRVAPVLERLAQSNALDPDDVSGRNSLRNRAEMEVRYARHIDEIAALRAAGVKLVVSSVHADCSERCSEFQGRVYSLDGTSGTTEDGKTYEPLEKATNIPYTTKAGKTYMNGLLGFNCRHYLMPYVPRMVIPTVNVQTEKHERKINIRQRQLERKVRQLRAEALQLKDIPALRKQFLAARSKAIEANRRYIKFSRDNGRAYYPSRTKLL